MPTNLPPGPSDPALLSTFKFWRRTAPFLEGARERYGDVWTMRLIGAPPFVMISDPQLVDQVFSADSAVLGTGVGDVGKPLMGEKSVLLLDGEEHTNMRRLLDPSFRSASVKRYRPLTERVTGQELAGWPLHKPRPLLPLMESITLGVIMGAIFGVTEAEGREMLRGRIDDVVDWGGSPVRMARMMASQSRGKPAPSSFVKVRNPMDVGVYEVIERARRDPALPERDDILATLVQARYDDGSPMSDKEIRDTLVTLMIQGHASTADALCWAIERLIRHPEAYERLRAESQTDAEEYLDAVVKETLRSRPPLPMATRMAHEPYELGEYELGVGMLATPCIYLVHHREDIYPEPHRFRPERFLEKPAERSTWLPFGGGERGCLGASFALHEIKAVLRTLMRQARFAPDDQSDEKIVRRRIGISPSRGARAVLEERLPAGEAAAAAA